MKKLKIYKEDGVYHIIRTNEFNHATRRIVETEKDLIETLTAYSNFEEYEIEAGDPELFALITNGLLKKAGEIENNDK